MVRGPGAASSGERFHFTRKPYLVRFGASVTIDCAKCGASKSLTGTEMVQACGAGDLKSSERRLRCSRCADKKAWLVALPPW